MGVLSRVTSTRLMTVNTVSNHEDAQRLASALGWPSETMGIIGATSSLLEICRPWRELGSMLSQIERRERDSQRRVQVATLKSVSAHLP